VIRVPQSGGETRAAQRGKKSFRATPLGLVELGYAM
jgi:hypothetical protein